MGVKGRKNTRKKVILEDTDIMPFGKYKKENRQMANVPASYLLWLHNNASEGVRETFPEVFEYIKDNMELLLKGS
jgi:uncharacterized protein (DUF3820 family)